MTTLVLHIGSPKAGSSAIQASLMQARWRRGWRGLPPNPYGKPLPSGFIAGCYLKPKALPRFLSQRHQQNPAQFESDLGRYRDVLQRCLQPRWRRSPQGAVLSSEYLWRLPRRGVELLRHDFEALGCDRFVVIGYVREPGSLYGSALQQWSRLSTDLKRFDPFSWRYALRRRLETWASVFGESLIVRPFERSQLVNGCVVRDFQTQIETALPTSMIWQSLPVLPEVNRSATSEELVAMQRIMAESPQFAASVAQDAARALTRLWDNLSTQVSRSSGSSILVRPEVLAVVRDRHADDLAWLADQYGLQFSGVATTSFRQAEDQPTEFSPVSSPARITDLIEPPEDQLLLSRLQDYLLHEGPRHD